MLAAHEERFRRIYSECLERPADGYAELLRGGEVSSPAGVDPEAWREEIRRQERQDKVRVMTYRIEGRAFAMLNRTVPDDQVFAVKQQALEQVESRGELAELSRVLGHELSGWLRQDHEFISLCERCGARLYTRLRPRRIDGGEALSELCPGEGAPSGPRASHRTPD
jgi:hypothetical protein